MCNNQFRLKEDIDFKSAYKPSKENYRRVILEQKYNYVKGIQAV
jgi:hypothetical protein